MRDRSKWATARFVAWDGEGVTVGGRHRYIMLRNSDGGGLTFAKGVTTKAALDALLRGFERAPDAWHVGFAFGYDVNMIVGDLPKPALVRLHRGRWLTWGKYRLRYRRSKSFTVQRWTAPHGWRGATLWDTFGFFQASFVRACEAYAIGAPEVRAAVEAMKAARSRFRADDLHSIQSYCEDECRLLVELMSKLKTFLDQAGLRLSRWDGAGAVAASLMTREAVKPMKAAAPDAVQDAIQYAFAGGRIELVQYGHFIGEIHHYDINSAYPSALRFCPCLSHGHWRHRNNPHVVATQDGELPPFSVFRVRWRFGPNARLFPFFWRAPDGRVFYPRSGEGWYWWPEVNAALGSLRARANDLAVSRVRGQRRRDEEHALVSLLPRRGAGRARDVDLRQLRHLRHHGGRQVSQVFANPRDASDQSGDGPQVQSDASLTILESWTWEPSCDDKPFHFIPPLFEQRRQWKREGRGAEKVLKLGLNSLYGKCAQHVGGTEETPPPWHQLEWAGWTTSWTRAALYSAAMQAPDAVIFLATDGIYTTRPLDLPLGKALGEWDYQKHVGLTAVQSGVYWVDNDDGTTTAYHRGFDPGSLERAAILDAWRVGRASVTARSTRFVGLGQALAGGEQWSRWRQWVDAPRVIQLTPLGTKRADIRFPVLPHEGLVPTEPYDPTLEGLPLMSTAAALPWRPLVGARPLEEEEVDDESEDAIL